MGGWMDGWMGELVCACVSVWASECVLLGLL